MPAPKTSTLVIPEVAPSKLNPVSATTEAVIASRVTLACVNALAMSEPNAGPPVTCTCKSAASPVAAAVRSALTASLRARPDKVVLSGTPPRAALPSCEGVSGCAGAAPGCAAAWARLRAARAALRSAGLSTAPSARLTTTISGVRSPPGDCPASAATRADGECCGSDCGAWPAAAFGPTRVITADAGQHRDRGQQPGTRTGRGGGHAFSHHEIKPFSLLNINKLK